MTETVTDVAPAIREAPGGGRIVLVAIESADDGAVSRTSAETLTLASRLAHAHGWQLEAVTAIDPTEVTLAGLRTQGVEGVHVLAHPHLDVDAAPSAVAEAIVQLATSVGAGVVMGPADGHSGEVFAHVAARMDRPLVTHTTAAAPAAEGGWELTRLRWGGMLLEDLHLDTDVALITVAPHQVDVMAAPEPSEVTVTRFAADLGDPKLHLTRIQERHAQAGGTSLATAPVVIAGGRGVGSAEGFAVLEELAELVGGAVGCSRVATNNGWRSHNDQVGQTGTRIAPELYIACGISGATQHWVGCMSSKRILAINTDAEAPMVTRADDAVLGDLHEVLTAVVELVRARTTVS